MGTRGAFGLRIKEEDKLSYNHWDSYPSHLGMKMLEVIRHFDDEQLAGAATRIVLVNEDEAPSPELQERYLPFANTGVNRGTTDEWYCLLREAQGDLVPYIDGRIDHMMDGTGFMADSLFCEWAYVINCDTRELEVYMGFNKNPEAPGRYSALSDGRGQYFGVKLVAQMPFDLIRKDVALADKFLLGLEGEEEE